MRSVPKGVLYCFVTFFMFDFTVSNLGLSLYCVCNLNSLPLKFY